MSCGAPLFSYSRFREGDDADDDSAGSGATILIIVIVVVLVIAAVCCWCFGRKSGGCGIGGCGRAGGRTACVAGADAYDVTSVEDFDFQTQSKCIVMFHADWCGHCQKTKPQFRSAAKKAKLPFMLVDCEKVLTKEHLSKYNVSGYPTILMLMGGEVLGTYDGDRSEESLVQFALG